MSRASISARTSAPPATAASTPPNVGETSASSSFSSAVRSKKDDADDAESAGEEAWRAQRACVRAALARRAGLSEIEARSAEVGVYNWSLAAAAQRGVPRSPLCPEFVDMYAERADSVADNLDARLPGVGNTRLLARARAGEFAFHEIAALPPERMFPERWQAALDGKRQRDEYSVSRRPAAMTDQFRCSRCKGRNCVYQELQTRSADESMTVFVACVDCKQTWRVG